MIGANKPYRHSPIVSALSLLRRNADINSPTKSAWLSLSHQVVSLCDTSARKWCSLSTHRLLYICKDTLSYRNIAAASKTMTNSWHKNWSRNAANDIRRNCRAALVWRWLAESIAPEWQKQRNEWGTSDCIPFERERIRCIGSHFWRFDFSQSFRDRFGPPVARWVRRNWEAISAYCLCRQLDWIESKRK